MYGELLVRDRHIENGPRDNGMGSGSHLLSSVLHKCPLRVRDKHTLSLLRAFLSSEAPFPVPSSLQGKPHFLQLFSPLQIVWDPEKMAFTSQLDSTLYHCQICLLTKFGVWGMHMALLCLDSESYQGRDLPPTSKRELLPWLHRRLLPQCLTTGFRVKHDPKSVLGGLCHLRQEAKISGFSFLEGIGEVTTGKVY